MTKNVGNVDKTLRIIVGALLILSVFVGPKTPWGWIGLIPLATGLMNWCPLYIPFKLSTVKKDK
jgi:hypothetical protein